MSLRRAAPLLAACLALAAAPPAVPAPRQPAGNGANAQVHTDRYGDPLPPGAVARLGTRRLRHPGPVQALACSPDGKRLASAGMGSWIYVWDTSTGKCLRKYVGSGRAIRSIAFSPNGKTLAAADGRLCLSDPATGRELRCPYLLDEVVVFLTFSPDGKTLATGSPPEVIRLWDVATGKQRIAAEGDRSGNATRVAFAPDGKTMASAGGQDWVPNTIRLWDAATGKTIRSLRGHKDRVVTLAFAPDGKTLASTGHDNAVRLWDVASGKELWRSREDLGELCCAAFAPDGKTLAVGGTTGFTRRDAATGKELAPLREQPASARALVFCPGGKTLAVASESGAIQFWDTTTGREQFRDAGHQGTVAAVVFSPDGKRVATEGVDNTVRIWEATTGKELRQFHGPRSSFLSAAVAGDGIQVFSLSPREANARRWDANTGRELRPFRGHKFAFRQLAATADGKWVVSAEPDGPLLLWEAATAKVLHRYRVSGVVHCLAVSPDGKTLAAVTGPHPPQLSLWDVASEKELRRVARPEEWPLAVAFSPDGRTLASAWSHGSIRLLDARSGVERARTTLDRTTGECLAFSPDGRMLAVGYSATDLGPDDCLCLLEVATGGTRRTLPCNEYLVYSVAFSPDGKLLASAGRGGTPPLVWNVTDPFPAGGKSLLTAAQRRRLWDRLTGGDAGQAWQAMQRLIAAGDEALPLLRDGLDRHQEKVRRIAHWVKELNADSFAVREQASRELAALGGVAATALRRAESNPPSPEVRRRARALLRRLNERSAAAADAVDSRAVEVLEAIGSAQASRFLQTLAGGGPESRLTKEAKASLRRLARQPATSR